MELPVYKILDGDLTFISLVEYPAVESNFLCFSTDKKPLPMKFDDGKRLITGVAMIADKPIYRYNPSMGEFYVTFGADVIERLALKFFKQHRNSDVNVEHTDTVDNITILESYFINHERGVVPSEFADMSDGSWIVTYKVENEDMYKAIKEGKVRGFSVEGNFTLNTEAEAERIDTGGIEEVNEDDLEAFIESLLD